MSVPRGFYETRDAPMFCDDFVPAFVRGRFIKSGELGTPAGSIFYPQWTLYGGPLSSVELAKKWDDYLYFWASSQGLYWLPSGPACIVKKGFGLAWPKDESFQWTQVYETSAPRIVTRKWDGFKYVWLWSDGVA